MGDPSLLALLQYGDSFFPSGSVSFSWGLEGLCNDKIVASPAQVARFVKGQLRHRWATADRAFITAAHAAEGDLGILERLDRRAEAMTLARELREGSTRAGSALLLIHEKMGISAAALYRRRIREGSALGHLAVVQGLVMGARGLDRRGTLAVSAHTLCVGFLGAAVRLGRIGHLDAQRILSSLHPIIEELLESPPPGIHAVWAYIPQAEIASMRHEDQGMRLFSN